MGMNKIPDKESMPVPLEVVFQIWKLVRENPELTPDLCHKKWQRNRMDEHWLPHDKYDRQLRVDPTIRDWKDLSDIERGMFIMHDEDEEDA